MNQDSLAIVIPAYRAQYLAASLKSVLAQTDQRFNLYVCDDASPEDIRGVAQSVLGTRSFQYLRFPDNLGGVSLPRHWNRCVEQSHEPWVWLFSDDDEMEPACVEAFWREIETTHGRFDLYRFNTRCINKNSDVMSVNEPYPVEERGRDFLMVRLLQTRASTSQELIFSRPAWAAIGGFRDFPLAWATDDAFIAELGKNKPIRLIDGPRIRWRFSGSNITSLTSTSVLSRKIHASRLFIAWANDFLSAGQSADGPLGKKELDAMTTTWFFRWLCFMRNRLSWETCSQVDQFMTETWNYPRGYGWLWCLQWNFRMLLAAAWRRITLRNQTRGN